jgi:hypothetical protein
MIKCRFFCVALLGLCGALVGVTLLLYDYARADVLGGPLPAPRMPRDIIPLTPVEKLGKLMLYDSTLSNPPGYACATCHVAETGYTGPNSEINAFSGPQPGVVPGRYSNRRSWNKHRPDRANPIMKGTKHVQLRHVTHGGTAALVVGNGASRETAFFASRCSSTPSKGPHVEKEQMLPIGPNEAFRCAVLRIDKHDVLWIAAWRVD